MDKPGYKTTEFWFALLPAQIMGMLVLFGVVTPEFQGVVLEQAPLIGDWIDKIVGAGIVIATAFKYMKSRADVKKKHTP